MHVCASANIDPDCVSIDDQAEISAFSSPPSLRLEMTEHDRRDPTPAERLADSDSPQEPGLEAASNSLLKNLVGKEQNLTDEVDPEAQAPGLPPTATRLPGIADEDLPRFRRQMFRTDI
jgi:hypothetical protein